MNYTGKRQAEKPTSEGLTAILLPSKKSTAISLRTRSGRGTRGTDSATKLRTSSPVVTLPSQVSVRSSIRLPSRRAKVDQGQGQAQADQPRTRHPSANATALI